MRVDHPGESAVPLDSSAIRRALGSFVTGVTVVTARSHDGAFAGVTVNSFNSVSLEPPLVLWSISLAAPSRAIFRDAANFAVNILAHDQSDLAMRFARPAADKFAGVAFTPGLGGAPLLNGAAAHFECETFQRYPGGDHEIIVGQVRRITQSDQLPLAFHRGQFGIFMDRSAADLAAAV
jgi:flavin reductase (DIM6/NTAB) family NADH-FMN oxidoreductase RutF